MASTGPSGPWDASDDSSNYDIPRSHPPPRHRRSTLRVSHLNPSSSKRTTFSQSRSRHSPVTRGTRSASKGILRQRGMESDHVAERVEDLAASLQATSEVLSTADRMLEHYRDINVEQDDEITKLRLELEKSAELLRRERTSRRRRALPVTPSTSQSEEELGHPKRKGLVRFKDDAKDQVDELRSAVRDLKSEQNRLTGEIERQREELDREKRGRFGSNGKRLADREGVQDPRVDLDRERLLKELLDTEEASRRQAEIFVKGLDAERSVLQESQRIASDRDKELESLRRQLQAAQRSQQDDIEGRLQEIQQEMRAERQMWEAKQKEVGELTSELRNVRTLLNDAADSKRKEEIHAVASELENERRESQYEKRVLQSRLDDLAARLEASERDRHQVIAELEKAVNRIDQTEGGKHALVEQAEDLRRKLSQSDKEKAQLSQQLEEFKIKQEENEGSHKRLQARFDALRCEVEEGNGDRERLLEQLEVLRGQVAKSDQEKEHIRQQISRITGGTGQRRQSLGPATSGGRGGLRRSSSVGAFDTSSIGLRPTVADDGNIRRNLDQMQRDRGVTFDLDRTSRHPDRGGNGFYDSGLPGIDSRDLTENLERLHEDVDRREEHQERLIQQMQDILRKYDESEEQRKKLANELEATVRQLKDSKRELQQLGVHLNDRDRELEESEKRRVELKEKALKAIKDYKSKCKKLEKEADAGKDAMFQNERLERELRELRSLASSGGIGASFMGTSRRDMDEMMDQRNRLNEELARKNSEIRELQAVRYSSERDLRDAKERLGKLENEVRTQQSQLASANLEKLKMEESLQAAKLERWQNVEKLESSQKHKEGIEAELRSTIEEQKREIKELRGKLSRLGSKLQDEVINRQKFEERMAEVREQGRVAKDEAGNLYMQLQQEREAHTNGLRELQEQIQTLTASHEQAMQELSRKSKHERTKLEDELAEMKLNLADEKSTIKALRKRQENDREEIERLSSELNISNEENVKLRSKYQQVRDDLENTKSSIESGQTRVKDLEDTLKRAQYSLEKLSEENLAGLQKLDDNLDSMIDVMCKDTGTPLPSLLASRGTRNDSRQFIADMTGKMRWLSEEMKISIANERRLREQTEWSTNRIKDLLAKADEDKAYFISELDKQSLLLEELATQKKGLESKYRQNTDEHKILKDRIRQLTNHLETSTRALHATAEALDDKQKVLDELDNLKGEKLERDRIHDRYVRYKEKVGSLRRELQGAKSMAEDFKQESVDAHNLSSRLFENLDKIASPKAKHRRLQTPDSPLSNLRPSSSNEGTGVRDWSPSSDSAISATTEDNSFVTPPYTSEKKRHHKTPGHRTSGPMLSDDLNYKERFAIRTPRV